MYYDRKIKYLDYYERGERVRGGGYVKLEARDGRLRMELAVTGMHATDSFSRDINLCTEKNEFTVGAIDISEGRGSYRQQWNQLENIGGSGIRYEELCGIRIPLGAGREISCRWQVQDRKDESRETQEKEEIKAAESKGGRRAIVDRGAGEASGVENKERKDIAWGGERGISEKPSGDERRGIGREGIGREGIGREVRDVSESENRNRERGRVSSENSMPEGRSGDRRGSNERGERDIPENQNGEERRGSRGELTGMSGSKSRNQVSSIVSSEKDMAESRSRGEGRSEREERYMGESWSGNRKSSIERGERDISGSWSGNVRDSNERREGDISGSRSGNVRGSVERGEHDISGSQSESVGSSIERRAGDMQKTANEENRKRKTVRLLENKWAQLWAIYPHIKPFNDEREYISIGPSDFVLFPEASYKMVNNSFLLHGFYNYNHLLLARVERRGEAAYYIGVPGNFYEKEKQVAIMFGFESFECAEEPAQAGDFGYYMMRTGL